MCTKRSCVCWAHNADFSCCGTRNKWRSLTLTKLQIHVIKKKGNNDKLTMSVSYILLTLSLGLRAHERGTHQRQSIGFASTSAVLEHESMHVNTFTLNNDAWFCFSMEFESKQILLTLCGWTNFAKLTNWRPNQGAGCPHGYLVATELAYDLSPLQQQRRERLLEIDCE